jgi:phage baseplate assembly protein W
MATANGVSVPFRFTSLGYPEACTELQCLHDSIYTILSTIPGERVMRPDFGCYLRALLFDPISRAVGFRARSEVLRAIRAWEPRVVVQDVLFELEDTTITVHVTWRSSGTQLSVTSLELPRNGA